jgi:cytochrome P450
MASCYLLLSLLIIPLLLFIKSKSKSLSLTQNYRLPPGPWTLPVIGSIHHLIGRGLPHHALRELSRQYGSLMFLQLGELPIIVVSSREAAREIMKTQDLKFSNRPVNHILKLMNYDDKEIVFGKYGELWRELKKAAIFGLLSSKRVLSFRSIREEEVNSVIKQISSVSCTKQVLNLSETLFRLVNDVTLRAIMGSKSKDKDLFNKELLNAVEFVALFKIANMFPSFRFLSTLTGVMQRAKQCRVCVERLVGDIIKEHRKEGTGDADNVISVLLRLYDKDSENSGISMDSIIATVFVSFLGIDSLSFSVVKSFYQLLLQF